MRNLRPRVRGTDRLDVRSSRGEWSYGMRGDRQGRLGVVKEGLVHRVIPMPPEVCLTEIFCRWNTNVLLLHIQLAFTVLHVLLAFTIFTEKEFKVFIVH